MSNDYSDLKHQHPKVHFEQYLISVSEPQEDDTSDYSPELEADLLENSRDMKRKFRHIAQRLKNLYS